MQHLSARAALALALLALSTAAQGRRLNAALPPAIAGDVRFPMVVSPDGSRVVFAVDAEQDERVELYSAPTSGGAAVKLNGPLAAEGDVTQDVLVTADSARVVYRADQDVDGRFELYSVPIAGGAVTKISGTLPAGAGVKTGVKVSASGRVVYRTTGGGNPRLWSAPSSGALPPTQLNAGVAFEQVQADFAISNDGLGVAYRSDAAVDGRLDLWVVTIDGSIAPQLRGSGSGSSDVLDFVFAPLDTHLVYRLGDDGTFVQDLYSVPIVGGAPTKLHPALPPGGGVDEYAVSADGARVVYTAEQVADQPGGLWSVALGGGAVTELNASDVSSFVLGGTGPVRVLYLDDEDGNGKRDLHTIPIEGGASSQFAFPNTDVQPGFEVAPDGARVIFRAINTLFATEPRSLYSAPIEGGTVVRLNSVTFDGTSVDAFAIAPDSASVLYVADQDALGVSELWTAPVAGGGSTRLSGTLTFDGDVQSVLLDPTGARAVYLADQDTNQANELYSVAVAGGSVSKLSPPLVTLGTKGSVLEMSLRPDGEHAVYLADQDVDDVFEAWSVPTRGGAPTRVNAELVPGGDVGSFEVSPDWSRVVYRADQDADGAYRLYSAPIGGGAAVAIDGGPTGDPDREDYDVSPDSTRVVYRADQDEPNVYELFSVPIGGGAIVQLNPALVAGGDVGSGDFLIAPDASRVVYVADQDANEVYELFSVPLAGGSAVQLNGTLVANGDTRENFAISADSSRVVYFADQNEAGVYELFSVPIAGGTAVRLNATLAVGGDVTSFALAPDSSRVAYRADQDANEVYELFSVPLAGGSAVQLNGTLVANGDTQEHFAISADSSRVLYRGDEATDGMIELFCAPIGGGPSVRLNAPLPAGRTVADFLISPDSTRAVYRADQDTDDVFELYGVELASGTITRLHAPLAPGASTPSGGVVTPDSLYVVVASDLVADEDERLYALPFSGAGPRPLSGPLAGGVRTFDVRAGRALYIAGQLASTVEELFVATLPRGMRQGSVPGGN